MFASRKDLKKFIEKVLKNNDFDGCWHYELGNGLYLVFAKNNNNDLDCKVAYNCDDLQCDYDWDWYMPENENGDLIGQDWLDILECGISAEELADEVIDSYNYVIGCGWTLGDNEEDDDHYAELI